MIHKHDTPAPAGRSAGHTTMAAVNSGKKEKAAPEGAAGFGRDIV